MATNIFDTSSAVAPVTQNQTPIQQPIVDDSTAKAIEAFGKIGTQAAGQILSARDLSAVQEEAAAEIANQQNIFEQSSTEADPTVTLTDEEKAELKDLDDTLNQMKQNISLGANKEKQQLLAQQKYAEKMRNAPAPLQAFYKQRAQQAGLFGGVTSSGKRVESPQEKADRAVLEEVSDISARTGWSDAKSYQYIRNREMQKIRVETAENKMDTIYTDVSIAEKEVYEKIVTPMLKNNPDGLPPELLPEYKNAIIFELNEKKREKEAKAAKGGYLTKKYQDEVDAEFEEAKNNLISFGENKDKAAIVAKRKQLSEDLATLPSLRTKPLDDAYAKKLINDDEYTLIWDAAQGDERALKEINSNRRLRNIYGQTLEVRDSLKASQLDAGHQLLTGNNPTWKETHGLNSQSSEESTQGKKSILNTGANREAEDHAMATLLQTSKGQELLHKAIQKDVNNVVETFKETTRLNPDSLTMFNNAMTLNTIKSQGKDGMRILSESFTTAIQGAKGSLYTLGWDGSPIRITRQKIPNYSGTYTYGTKEPFVVSGLPSSPQTASIRQTLVRFVKVAENSPELWKGKYNSPEAYVEAMVNQQIGTTPEEREEAETRARLAKERADEEKNLSLFNRVGKTAKRSRPNAQSRKTAQSLVDAGYTDRAQVEKLVRKHFNADGEITPEEEADMLSILNSFDELTRGNQEGGEEESTIIAQGSNEEQPKQVVEGEPLSRDQALDQTVRTLERMKQAGMTDEEIIQKATEQGLDVETVREALKYVEVES